MLVGIVADTHDSLELVEAAVETFEDRGVEVVVHCGDIVAPFSAARFDGQWEFHAVRGNNDGEWALQSAVEAFGTHHGEMGELTFDDRTFAVYHGTSEALVDALVECGSYDYVVHGHTHVSTLEDSDGVRRINPGGIAFEGAPEPFEVAVVDTQQDDVEFERLG